MCVTPIHLVEFECHASRVVPQPSSVQHTRAETLNCFAHRLGQYTWLSLWGIENDPLCCDPITLRQRRYAALPRTRQRQSQRLRQARLDASPVLFDCERTVGQRSCCSKDRLPRRALCFGCPMQLFIENIAAVNNSSDQKSIRWRTIR